MPRFGIISGTVFTQAEGLIDHPEDRQVETAFGPARVFLTDQLAFIPRHGADADHHLLPHRINHPANLSALKALGVQEIIAVNSTGSMNRALKPGMFAVPDDFIMLAPGPTVYHDQPVHIIPTLDGRLRQRLLDAARDCRIDVFDGGVYWQTTGPRFETRAEIRFMSGSADLVGMTMASEAIVAKELDMAYASLCSVDNYAHGVMDEALAMDDVIRNARQNAEAAVRIIRQYLERRG